MKPISLKLLAILLLASASLPGWGQSCQTRDEIPGPDRTAIENTAAQIFTQAASGDVNTLKANSIPALQSSFDGIAGAVNDNKAALAGAHPQLRTTFMLDTGNSGSTDGRFYCGVFGANGLTANGAEFYIPNLPVGKYAVVIQDFIGSKGPYALSTILQQMGGWKLAGFYVRSESSAGHDGIWYLQQARDYKSKGQNHNAWFYYVTSWDLLAPVTFMDTKLLSTINKESTGIRPTDVPSGGKAVTFSANGKTYNITDISIFGTDTSFDLSIKYSVPSAADFNATQADARGLAAAYVAQYPELKEAFNNVMAHAVDPSGADVVGLVPLKPVSR